MSFIMSEGFEDLWEKYNKRIYYYFRRQFDADTAEDLCQQTYLKVWSYICTCQNTEIRNKKAWIFAIAKNVKNDYLRYISIHKMNFDYENLYDKDIPYEQKLDDSITLQKALSSMNKEDRELLSMAEHLTSREIGSVLGISPSAVRSRIQKAKEKLKAALKEYDVYR